MLSPAEVRRAPVGDLEIAYEALGEATDPPVVLISGLGGQLTSWDDDFCQELTDRGLFVIRFDNRDVGLSSHLAEGPTGSTEPAATYTLSDMAADTVGLLDHLGLGSAHVVGLSLGGMIAQILAIEHPGRVRSLTSIMSTTGSDQVGQATGAAMGLLLMAPVSTRDDAMDRARPRGPRRGLAGVPGGGGLLARESGAGLRSRLRPPGVARQLAAALGTPDRTEDLRRLDLPTLVIHGAEDPLIAVSGGRATADGDPRSGAGCDRGDGSRAAEAPLADRGRTGRRAGQARPRSSGAS